MSEHEEQHPARAWGSQAIPAHIAARLADAEARAETAEAKVARVEALCDQDIHDLRSGVPGLVRLNDLREALRGDQ